MRITGIPKSVLLGNENCLFSSLEMLAFDEPFGSYALRQLVADHVNYNKKVYIDNIEGDFSK